MLTLQDTEEWSPINRSAAIALAALSAWIVWQHYFTDNQWILLLDHANLALHEAGHPIVAMLSDRLPVYGGTLFQLLFPGLFLRHFWRQRQSAGWVVCAVWLGASLMNVARYMKDARAQVLPLVGGGDHDWTEIFSRWGVLGGDVRFGGFVQVLGLCTIIYAVFRVWRPRGPE